MRCRFGKCSGLPELTYIGQPVCRRHWEQLCSCETAEAEGALLEQIGLIRVNGEVYKRTRARSEDRQACDSQRERQDEKPTGLVTGVEHVLDVGAEPTWSSNSIDAEVSHAANADAA